MNKLIICLLVFAFSSEKILAKMTVPSDFLMSNEANEVNLNSTETKGFGLYLDEIFSYQEEVLDNADLKSSSFVGGWKVSGYKTDLSISKSGVFGIGALKAQTAVELEWAKRKNNFTNSENLETPFSISLNQEMTEDEIRDEIEPIIRMAINSGKVKNEKKLRKNLFKKTREMHFLMRGIFNNGDYHWEVSKFRLNLNFGVSGNIFHIARVEVTLKCG